MTSKTTNKFSSEVRTRAVRMVQEHGGEYPSGGRLPARSRQSPAPCPSAQQALGLRFTYVATVPGIGQCAGVSSR